MRQLRNVLIMVFGLIIGGVHVATAEPVTLAWNAVTTNSDQSPITDLCCYKIYWGTSPGVHPNSLNVGNVTQATIGGLDASLTYYFVIRAVDVNDNESVVSTEVSARPDRVTTF